ncbi:hypothetical protein ACLFBA_20745, partial [Mycobacterium tuberculosis variant caprae]
GWVLAEGHGADGAILDRNELELHSGRNAQAIHTAEQLAAEVLPTTLGWVLAEGHGADGAILDRNELELHSGRNAQAIHTAEQLA